MGVKNGSVILRKQCKLQMPNNMILRKIFISKVRVFSIWKDIEGINHGPILGTIPASSWKK